VATSRQVARKSIIEFQTTQVAKEWIAQSGYELLSVDAQDDEVNVLIGRAGDPPTFSELVSALQENIRYQVVLELEIESIQSERQEILPVDE